METLWFWLVSVMVAIYVVMDGFDFGAGILHLAVAKTNEERRQVLGAIGPLWDGNEVWLLAGGGSLFLAFPKVLASGFSGFYLAMWLVVWSLMLRGISIEFRSHVADGLWRHFWDATFAVSSVLLPVLLGAALGNVLRGVPLDGSGYFSMPLWTDFQLGPQPGILDWYTVLIGVFALVTVTAHGALFLAWKTDGPVHLRARHLAPRLWLLVLVGWVAASAATARVNPAILHNLPGAPLAWVAILLYLAGLGLVFLGLGRERYLLAFLGSLGGTLLVQHFDPQLLKRLVPLLLFGVAVLVWVRPQLGAADIHPRLTRGQFDYGIAFSIGVYDGFLGPGTGTFLALAFMLGLGFNLARATTNTKALNWASNVASLLLFLAAGKVWFAAGLIMGAGQWLGARAGSRMVMTRGTQFIRPVFLTMVVLLTLKMIYDNYLKPPA